jgi:hypothetical protein
MDENAFPYFSGKFEDALFCPKFSSKHPNFIFPLPSLLEENLGIVLKLELNSAGFHFIS